MKDKITNETRHRNGHSDIDSNFGRFEVDRDISEGPRDFSESRSALKKVKEKKNTKTIQHDDRFSEFKFRDVKSTNYSRQDEIDSPNIIAKIGSFIKFSPPD